VGPVDVLLSKPLLGALTKSGPWAILAIALIAYLLLDVKGEARLLAEKLDRHMATQDVQVLLLRVICTGVANTEAERTACREVGK